MKASTIGIIDLVCRHSVAETVERLEALLLSKGIKIFIRIDHAAEARAVGLIMPPTVLLIFGNPKLGTPLMANHPSLALDLPTKALIWESADGGVWLSYNSPKFLQQRHGLEDPPFGPIIALFHEVTQ